MNVLLFSEHSAAVDAVLDATRGQTFCALCLFKTGNRMRSVRLEASLLIVMVDVMVHWYQYGPLEPIEET